MVGVSHLSEYFWSPCLLGHLSGGSSQGLKIEGIQKKSKFDMACFHKYAVRKHHLFFLILTDWIPKHLPSALYCSIRRLEHIRKVIMDVCFTKLSLLLLYCIISVSDWNGGTGIYFMLYNIYLFVVFFVCVCKTDNGILKVLTIFPIKGSVLLAWGRS